MCIAGESRTSLRYENKQKKQEPFCKSKKNAPEFWRKEQWHK